MSGEQRRMEWPDWVALGAFAVVIGFAISRHEPWRDELDPWLRVRDAHSLADLRAALKHTGHPLLWYALLAAIRSLGVQAIPYLHGVIALGYAYLLVRFAPFPRALRVLLLFGYYFIFEYAVIARCYGLGACGLFIFCALFPQRRERLVAMCVVLALMAQVSVHTLAVTAGCSLALLIAMPERRTVVGLSAVGASAMLSVWSMWPSRDNVWLHKSFNGPLVNWQHVSRYLLDALVPVPAAPPHYWNHGRLAPWIGSTPSLIAMLLLCAAVVWSLRRARPALALWVAASGGLLCIFMFVYFGYLRHHGHLWLTLVAAFWLAHELDPPRRRLRVLLLGALAVVHLGAGAYSVALDAQRPFSNVVATARKINQLHLPQGTVIIGDSDTAASALTAFLPGTIYFPASERAGTYIDFDHEAHASDAQVLAAAARIRAETMQAPLVVLNRALPDGTPAVHLQASFEGAAVFDENFWVYTTD